MDYCKLKYKTLLIQLRLKSISESIDIHSGSLKIAFSIFLFESISIGANFSTFYILLSSRVKLCFFTSRELHYLFSLKWYFLKNINTLTFNLYFE